MKPEDPQRINRCPYCKNAIPNGTTWCATCGTNIVRSTGKYPIHYAWIVLSFAIVPFAVNAGCIASNGTYYSESLAVAGLSIVTGFCLIAYNLRSGRH